MTKNTLALAAALTAAVLPMSAMANRPGFGFVRVEGGSSTIKVESGGARGDGDDTAFSVRGGYYFSPNIAVEGFYENYGERSEDGATAKLEAIGVGVTGKKNFGDDDLGFFVGGRVGVQRSQAKIEVTGFGSDRAGSIDPYVGASVGYDFSPNWGVSLNYDYTRSKPEFNGGDIDIKVQALTLAGEYRF